MKPSENKEPLTPARIRNRPFLCSIILSAALTYFLILALLFLAAIIFSGKIMDIIRIYYDPEINLKGHFLWIALTGAILYGGSVAGIILFMLKRKSGFFIFFAATLIIFSLDFAFLEFDWLRYLIHSGFIFTLGIAHFSKRCYLQPTETGKM
jgi:hypothetical protein